MRLHWARSMAALLLLIVPVGGPQALAQEPGDTPIEFSVTPSRLEVRLAPGDSLQFAIQVINHSDQALTLLTYIDDIDIPPNELITSDELAFTASRWMRFEADELQVPGDATAEAMVTAEIPEDTPSGGYHAVAYFQAVGPEVPLENGIVALGRIGATLLLEVAPSDTSLTRAARVSATELDVSWEDPLTPRVAATVVADNSGDLHLTAGGVHTYRVWPGQGYHEEKVGPATLLRGTRHSFQSELEAAPILGRVSLVSEIVYQVGPDELPVIVTQASVWIIPWHLIVLLLVAGGLGVGGVIFLRARRGPRLDEAVTAADREDDKMKAEV